MDQRLSETSSSSSMPSSSTSCSSSSSSLPTSTAISVTVNEEPASSCSSQVSVTIERQGNNHSSHCKWKIHNFSSKLETRAIWSNLFEVEGFNCRFLVYPKGDSQSKPGYCSIYLHIIIDTRKDCFASYRLSIVNLLDESRSVWKDSWHRFSRNEKSHGWCDFALVSTIVDPKSGFISADDDYVVITADILVLEESISFFRDNNEFQQASTLSTCPVIRGQPLYSFLDGRFTWKIHNFSLFKEKIKTQKIMSPYFHGRNCSLSISVYQSCVNGTEYLSMCLESMKNIYKSGPDQSCWCLLRISVKTKKPGLNNIHRDLYGRLSIDSRSGDIDNASLGWNDYMKMSDFIRPDMGFLVKDTAVFTASFQIIRESYDFKKSGGSLGERSIGGGQTSDEYIGKFTWRIHEFTRLRDLSMSRNLFGLCVKSRRFQIGDRDCRLLVYPCPRGQSQTQCHLSLFLEVTDSQNTASDWSCFVCQRLSVVNQWMENKSIVKESQNRYSKDAKDWGWRDFVTLGSLFDQHAEFLVQDSIVFSAEVLILKETSEMKDFSGQGMELSKGGQTVVVGGEKRSFTWKLENFSSFKEIMKTRKIFSNFFQAGKIELQIGVYESFDTICMYLESDQSAGIDPDKNFWVKYKMGVVNQNNSDNTLWKESTMFTNTWNKSVLQLMKVSDMLEGDAGFLLGDTIVFVCYIMDCSPWFDFSDLEEFNFNPNEKSFTSPQTPLRSPSPVSDGSYYFRNNVSAVQHMQSLPMGVGIETSFARPRSVMYNPQAAPNQLPQALIHPSAHLIGTLFAGPPPVIYNPQAAPIQSPPAFIHPNAHLIGTSFAGPQPVMYNPQAAPIQSPQAYYHPNTHLAPIQSPQAFIHLNAHLAAPIQSPQAFIHPNTHPPVMYNQQAPVQSPQAFIHPNAHLAPIQPPQAYYHPNTQLAPVQSPQAFIHPNAHLAPIQPPQAFIHPNTHSAAPIQSPQAFIHPNAYLYGRPMMMGHHPGQVMYRPGYPPIRPYQGRNF